MDTVKSQLPKESLLNVNKQSYHYIDSFQGSIIDKEDIILPIDVLKAFFNTSPKWIETLFTFRNKLVRVFGLKITNKIQNKKEIVANLKGEPDEQIGIFKIFETSNQEIVLGENDKHLNFRVSLFIEKNKTIITQKQITITTTVVFNNWFGKLYFFPVKPFHKIIVPVMLKETIKNLNQKIEANYNGSTKY